MTIRKNQQQQQRENLPFFPSFLTKKNQNTFHTLLLRKHIVQFICWDVNFFPMIYKSQEGNINLFKLLAQREKQPHTVSHNITKKYDNTDLENGCEE